MTADVWLKSIQFPATFLVLIKKKDLFWLPKGADMMIEADVSMGTLTIGNDSSVIPIMAHPPHKTSDLSLEQFLTTILKSGKRKGIKLDFKDIAIVEPALAMLKRQENQVCIWHQ